MLVLDVDQLFNVRVTEQAQLLLGGQFDLQLVDIIQQNLHLDNGTFKQLGRLARIVNCSSVKSGVVVSSKRTHGLY